MLDPVQISPLRLSDVEAAFNLGFVEGWNQTKEDWLRLLKHQPDGCFGAYNEGRLVGTVATAIYGSELAWVGMMLVERECRGSGIGRKLMLTALEYAKARVGTIKLDATPAGRTLYETLGFVPEAGIERWEKCGTPPQVGADSVVVDTTKVNEICKIDRQSFGADRTAMLKLLSHQSCAQPVIVNTDGNACGYAMARPGSRAIYVGPIVSTNLLRRSSLLDSMVGQFPGRSIYVDLYKGSSASSDILSAKGFVKQRDLTRMYWGRTSRAGLSPSIFAIAGPEIG